MAMFEATPRPRRRRQSTVVLLAILLAGCCTQKGCGTDVRFSRQDLSHWAGAEEFDLEICVEQQCQTYRITPESSQVLGAPMAGFEHLTEVQVEVVALVNGVRRTAAGEIEVADYRPNGGLCPPVCAGADVAIDGDTLRNGTCSTNP